MYQQISTPGVVVELEQVEKNIQNMAVLNNKHGIAIRPHIKPHKSVYLAGLQLSFGSSGITCATLREAEVMADAGINNILIAYPLIGIDKMNRLAKLLNRIEVICVVNSLEGAIQLSTMGASNCKQITVLIEVDGGLKRGGLPPMAPTLNFAKDISHLTGIQIKGIMYYGGLIYSEVTTEGYASMARKERDEITTTAELLSANGFDMHILSGGNSYSSRFPELLEGITEVRCGNYIFNDVSTLFTGFATEAECSLRVVATVIAVVDEKHAIIDAGSKTLSTDLSMHRRGYGYVINRPDLYISKLNEEHGFIESSEKLNLKIGDKIAIIPNHACVVPNLTDRLYGIRNHSIERMVSVDARSSCVS